MNKDSRPSVRSVSIADITVPEKRHRQTMHDPEPLAKSMDEVGLLHPIGVTTDNVLVFGLHRFRAAESLGWETIDARTIEGDELDTELAEIDENLRDHSLTVAEQSDHVARREAIMQARHERRTVGRHSNPATVAVLNPKTTEELAKEAGISERTYQNRAKIGRGLSEETKEILSELDPADSDLPNSTRQLNYLAGVDDPEDQAEIARRVATGEAVSVWKASDQLKGERGEKEEKTALQMYAEDGEAPNEAHPVSIKRVRTAEFTVRFSNGKNQPVNRAYLLSLDGWKKCSCCNGFGISEPKTEEE